MAVDSGDGQRIARQYVDQERRALAGDLDRVSIFFIASAFQFGNNLGVHTAFNAYVKFEYIVVVLMRQPSFLFCFKNLYRALEKLMMGFVGLSPRICRQFVFAKPKIGEWGKGFVPSGMGRLILRFLGWWG